MTSVWLPFVETVKTTCMKTIPFYNYSNIYNKSNWLLPYQLLQAEQPEYRKKSKDSSCSWGLEKNPSFLISIKKNLSINI